jgi:hypothetical protein
MDRLDQVIATNRALRAVAAEARAAAQETRWRSAQARQRMQAARLARQEIARHQRSRQAPLILLGPPDLT